MRIWSINFTGVWICEVSNSRRHCYQQIGSLINRKDMNVGYLCRCMEHGGVHSRLWMLPAWWALWFPWLPPAGCNNSLMYLLIFTMNFCYCFVVVFCWKSNLLMLYNLTNTTMHISNIPQCTIDWLLCCGTGAVWDFLIWSVENAQMMKPKREYLLWWNCNKMTSAN